MHAFLQNFYLYMELDNVSYLHFLFFNYILSACLKILDNTIMVANVNVSPFICIFGVNKDTFMVLEIPL